MQEAGVGIESTTLEFLLLGFWEFVRSLSWDAVYVDLKMLVLPGPCLLYLIKPAKSVRNRLVYIQVVVVLFKKA